MSEETVQETANPVDLKKVGLDAAHDRRWGENHGYTNEWLIETRQGRRYGYLVALPTIVKVEADA